MKAKKLIEFLSLQWIFTSFGAVVAVNPLPNAKPYQLLPIRNNFRAQKTRQIYLHTSTLELLYYNIINQRGPKTCSSYRNCLTWVCFA